MRLYTSPKEMKHKIMVGNFTVWAILLVSLMVSLFYWYQISGLTIKDTSINPFEELMLWSAVAVGFLAELVKKVTLSTFRNKKIWIFATIVSVLTVMGSFAILDQSRNTALTKGSDSYKTAKDDKAMAKGNMAQYAHVANKPLQSLLSAETANIQKGGSNAARRKSGMSYQQFVMNRDRIKKDIQDRKDYESAVAMYDLAKNDMTGSSGGTGTEVSNPLFGQIKTVTGFTISAITLTFFLAVTLLLEISAFYVGGEIQEFKNFLNLTEAELLDIQNQSMFGVSVQTIMRDQFASITDAMRDQKDADTLIMQMRLNKTNEQGTLISSGEVSKNIRSIRKNLADGHRQAKQKEDKSNESINANNASEKPLNNGDLDLEGHSSQDLIIRRDEYVKIKKCPACHADIEKGKFCSGHSTAFYSYVRGTGNKLNTTA